LCSKQAASLFSRCSNAVKNVLFRSFCTLMCASQLWWNCRKSCMKRLRVAYNFGCRALYNLPWRACVNTHDSSGSMEHPTFEAVLRKNMHLFLERCRRSNKVIVGCFDAVRLFMFFLYFEHYSTTSAFYFVTECSDIAVFFRLRMCMSQCIRTLPGLDQYRN